jgi:4-hydroxy-3-methylbut-2-enyl diphosphate reductase
LTRIEKADRTGFCFGVRRAIGELEKIARENGGVETLGAVVHNRRVLERLARNSKSESGRVISRSSARPAPS